MEREYDKVLDSKKGIKLVHREVRKLLSNASFHLDLNNFDRVEAVYLQIECLMASVGESARVLQQKQEEESK